MSNLSSAVDEVQEGLKLDFTKSDGMVSTVGRFILAVMEARAEEYALFGIRGDGKTIGVLGAILAHAEVHRQKGFDLPVPWLAIRDTFANHKTTTIESLQKPLWKGCWRLYDSNHLAVFRGGKDDLAMLKLTGVDDLQALNKLRQEVVGIWGQEAAPVAQESSGISSTAWGLANSSKGRIPTYHSPSLLDLNYPDEDHWTWQDFIVNPRAGTMAFRIPPRENKHVDPIYWTKMEQSLASRPDLKRRLLDGQPGTIQLGPQVAQGFNLDVHVARERIRPIQGEPIVIGWDFGHTPTVVIGQEWRGYARVCAAIPSDHSGVRQLVQNYVKPWLAKNAAWAPENPDLSLLHWIDPSGNTEEQTDIDQSPRRVIEEMLGGTVSDGPVKWEARKGPLLAIFNRYVQAGSPALQIDPVEGQPLIKALNGRWYYPQDRLGNVSRDLPKKPNHPWEDLGDAFVNFLVGVSGANDFRAIRQPIRVNMAFDARRPPETLVVNQNFDPRGT